MEKAAFVARGTRASSPAERENERVHTRDWLEAFDAVIAHEGRDAGERLLRHLWRRAQGHGIRLRPSVAPAAYVNTIPTADEPRYPGDLELEARIEALVRWNAAAMVVRANRRGTGLGGHIATYASAATLFEVGLEHVFRGADHPEGPDLVFFQGHASPGVYARAFLEGRLSEQQLERFRREVGGDGLSSYPHPWLMPDLWEMPSVSMGLSPLMAIYAARFGRYLRDRGIVEHSGRVWALVGDGEMDEPESVGALTLAAREGLGNLTFVVNGNLQRLDGPVRGNDRFLDELERLFAGAGWNVIKVLWSHSWDPLFEADVDGALVEKLSSTVDGTFQRLATMDGAAVREEFFGDDPRLASIVEHLDDATLGQLFREGRGGHDPRRVYAAYAAAEAETERPTVILAQTVKGLGLGAAGEALNVAHKAKTMDSEALRSFRDRFSVPVGDEAVEDAPFVRPDEDGPELRYLRERREALGGFVPRRRDRAAPLPEIPSEPFDKHRAGTERPATTTMVAVRLLADLLRHDEIGPRVVPIVPDEARTFGVEALFPQVGMYQPQGQRYTPVDEDTLTPYLELEKGQLLEEGITEAGALASSIAVGTSHCVHAVAMVPFYFFYSMFGFQRVGDLLWAAGDARARGFLLGATSGRTTLHGEGLQHQDGHSHVIASTHPRVRAYDPAYGYELATIIEDGLRRMYVDREDVLYYLTVTNEPQTQPAMPEDAHEGILRGMHRVCASSRSGEVRRAHVLASGPMVPHALEAQRRLESDWGVTVDVWSVTSWTELYRDCRHVERWNRLHPDAKPRLAWLQRCLGDDPGAVLTVSDHLSALGYALARWLPRSMVALGTDGFGRSDEREVLRDFFEVDERYISLGVLRSLVEAERYPAARLERAIEALDIDSDKPDPMTC